MLGASEAVSPPFVLIPVKDLNGTFIIARLPPDVVIDNYVDYSLEY